MGTYQFIDSEGNSIGPVSLDTLRKMRQAGHLGGHTQILDEATKRFLRLDQLLGVAATEGATVLPPPPSSAKTKRYFFADTNNTPVGPFTIEELQRQLIDKKIRAETQIIEEGGTVWQPYANVMMDRLREGTGGAVVPPPPPSSNPKETSLGGAILWFFFCLPLGFMQWNQAAKGWVWVIITIVSGGLAGLVAVVDYWMCFSAQQKRKLGEWEFFPRK